MHERKILPLPPSLITKIAAGEVIERPVYAIKELLDNAIDAQATEIKIILEDSGLKRITVIDNGIGMTNDDLQEAWKLHTTSKLHDEQSLNSIKTLGFRGEALASIAAISKLVIKSKAQNEKIGSMLEVVHGIPGEVSPTGLPQGTEVSVHHLFNNVPGRKKFLKSERTELRQSLNMISSYALAYPKIRFTLIHNDRILFDLPQTTNRLERICSLFGNSLKQTLQSISFQNEYLSLSGYISRLQATTLLSQKQHIFINNRVISDKLLMSAVRDAYTEVHVRTVPATVFLFLTLPYEMVDVNVHPRKEEVRFHNAQQLYDIVLQTITASLQSREQYANAWPTGTVGLTLGDGSAHPGLTDSFAAELLRGTVLQDFDTNHFHQIHRVYIVKETKQGLEFVDQHAAHERILYEKLLAQFTSKRKNQESIQLKKPQRIELAIADSELLQEHLATFAQLGFQIDLFKESTFFVHAIPTLFKDRNLTRLLADMLNDLQQEKKIKNIDILSKRMIAYLACRAAVKAGDQLTEEQMRDILTQLEQTPNNQTCPHGRPTRQVIEIGKIHKLFKRKE